MIRINSLVLLFCFILLFEFADLNLLLAYLLFASLLSPTFWNEVHYTVALHLRNRVQNIHLYRSGHLGSRLVPKLGLRLRKKSFVTDQLGFHSSALVHFSLLELHPLPILFILSELFSIYLLTLN